MKAKPSVSEPAHLRPPTVDEPLNSDSFSELVCLFSRLKKSVSHVITGKEEVIKLVLTALVSRGHLLLEDIPGVGKTTLAKSIAKSISASYSRIQFTPDLLPADITGSTVYSPKKERFFWSPGPLFANIVLADEINRTSPRSQSALLEAMEEHQVSVDGVSHPLPEPFFVIATQNPYELHGTFPLPEGQTDRFLMSLSIGLPDRESERRLIRDRLLAQPLDSLSAVVGTTEIKRLQAVVRRIEVADKVLGYALDLIDATRRHDEVELGATPRASLALVRTCQGLAFAAGRSFVTPDDVQEAAAPVLSHRIVLKSRHLPGGSDAAALIADILAKRPVPV